MRLPLIIAVCLCLGAVACERKPARKPALKFHSEETLHEDTAEKLTFTTHYTEGPIGLPVWQVWYHAAGASSATPLFTVERVWQEGEPGAPVYEAAGAEPVVQDELHSYVYSIRQRVFTRNVHSDSVYRGAYHR